MDKHAKDEVTYERPDVVDYGTLVDITRQGNVANRDMPNGNNNTAYPNGS